MCNHLSLLTILNFLKILQHIKYMSVITCIDECIYLYFQAWQIYYIFTLSSVASIKPNSVSTDH